jgi:hypothetical protein
MRRKMVGKFLSLVVSTPILLLTGSCRHIGQPGPHQYGERFNSQILWTMNTASTCTEMTEADEICIGRKLLGVLGTSAVVC